MEELNFLYDNTKINKNKLKENWLVKNNPDFLEKLLKFKSNLTFEISIFSQLIWHYKNNQLIYPICEYCNGQNSRFIGFEKGYEKTCSRHCGILLSRPAGIEQRRKNTLEKYGVEHTTQLESVKKKMAKTSLERYGVESYTKTDECKNKKEKTNIERYGAKTPLQNEQIKSNLKEYFIEKYGFDNPTKSPIVLDKIRRTNLERRGVEWSVIDRDVQEKSIKTMIDKFGVECNFKLPDFREKADKKMIEMWGINFSSDFVKIGKRKILGEFYSNIFLDDFESYDSENHILNLKCSKGHTYSISPQFISQRKRLGYNCCIHCNPINNPVSKGHQQLIDYLISLDPNIKIEINNRKVLDGLELDIYLPDFNLGIEYNGVYWHSELHKTKTYHIDKYKKSKEMGIELIQIWEDTFLDKFEIIKSILKLKLGIIDNKIGARKCIIKEISSKEANEFLENNHLQGSCVSTKRYGLYYGDILVSVATFGKGRVNLVGKKNEWEILRLSTKRDWVVSGGLLRLFNHFISDIKPGRVISYSDNDLFSGGIYQKLGMVLENDIIPSYTWSDGFIRKNRWNFRKDKLVKEGADKSLTEVEIMHDRGWFRCFSSGQKKWILNL
jgi:hypothetical protein